MKPTWPQILDRRGLEAAAKRALRRKMPMAVAAKPSYEPVTRNFKLIAHHELNG